MKKAFGDFLIALFFALRNIFLSVTGLNFGMSQDVGFKNKGYDIFSFKKTDSQYFYGNYREYKAFWEKLGS